MRYLLDTCVISDFIKGEAGTTAKLKQTPPVDIAVSAVTVMELRYELALNPQRAQKVAPAISSFLSSVRILLLQFYMLDSRFEAGVKSHGSNLCPSGSYLTS